MEWVCCVASSRFLAVSCGKEGGSAATLGGTQGVEGGWGWELCLPCLTGPYRFEDLWCRDFSPHAGFLSTSKNGSLKAFVALQISIGTYYTKQERGILVTG